MKKFLASILLAVSLFTGCAANKYQSTAYLDGNKLKIELRSSKRLDLVCKINKEDSDGREVFLTSASTRNEIMETKTDEGYLYVYSPSRFSAGQRYIWAVPREPWNNPVLKWPKELINGLLATTVNLRVIKDYSEKKISEGIIKY